MSAAPVRGTALVTGAGGFLGPHLCRALQDAGWSVRALDVGPLPDDLAAARTITADVRDGEAMRRAAEGCEVVVGNAALVPVTRSTAEGFRSVNVDGCRRTLEAARAAGAYVVHVSSSAIYGSPDTLPVTSATPLRPFEPYGASKAEAEGVVAEFRRSGMAIAGLRSRALLGRGRLGLFELIFRRIAAGRRVPLFGRGDNVLQMCDARDFAAAMVAAIDRRADGDYNVGAAQFGTPREDLQALVERVGSTSTLQPVPVWAIRAVLQPLALAGRSPFTAWHWHASSDPFFCDLDETMRDLGWTPRYSNVDALLDAYEHLVAGHAGGSAHSTPLGGALARVLRG